MSHGLITLVEQGASALMPHLMLAPIALPLLTGALMLLMREEQRLLKLVVNVLSTALGLLVSLGVSATLLPVYYRLIYRKSESKGELKFLKK